MTAIWKNTGIPGGATSSLQVKKITETEAEVTLSRPGDPGKASLILISAIGLRANADVSVANQNQAVQRPVG